MSGPQLEFGAVCDRVETIEFGRRGADASLDVGGSDVHDDAIGIGFVTPVDAKGEFGMLGTE